MEKEIERYDYKIRDSLNSYGTILRTRDPFFKEEFYIEVNDYSIVVRRPDIDYLKKIRSVKINNNKAYDISIKDQRLTPCTLERDEDESNEDVLVLNYR